MRTHLGWFTYLLALAFAIGTLGTLSLNTWFGLPSDRAVAGFFGFGLSAVVGGAATSSLWENERSLQTLLGWAATMFGIACGVAVLLLVAGWVLKGESLAGPSVWRFLAFGVTGVASGAFGLATLPQPERQKEPRDRPTE